MQKLTAKSKKAIDKMNSDEMQKILIEPLLEDELILQEQIEKEIKNIFTKQLKHISKQKLSVDIFEKLDYSISFRRNGSICIYTYTYKDEAEEEVSFDFDVNLLEPTVYSKYVNLVRKIWELIEIRDKKK